MKNKKAFTLIELLIAIFLVSLFAYIVFATPTPVTKRKVEVNASTLPTYLQEKLSGDGDLICTNKCTQCYYIMNSLKPISIYLPLNLKVKKEYILDRSNNPQKLELSRFKDEKICLRIHHYKNGSISQVILDLGDKFLFIPSYFGEGKEFESLNEAADWWVKDSQNELRSRGDWY